MDAAGLGLAVLDLCMKYTGVQLYAFCRKYQHADRDIRENILCIEAFWLKTQSQIEALRDIWDTLDERVQLHQSTVLSLLDEKLQVALALLQGLDPLANNEPSLRNVQASPKGDINKFKYALSTSRKLEKVLRELEKWHKIFDPSWYLLARTAAPMISQQTTAMQGNAEKEIFIIEKLRHVQEKNLEPITSKNSIFLSNQCPIQDIKRISNTSAQNGYFEGQPVIVDSLSVVDSKNIQESTKDVRDMARILATVDPFIFGLLTCQGVIKKHGPSQITGFDIIFVVPNDLNGRFRLAKLLARSVSFLHIAQIVHKNISPETIILLENTTDKVDTPFLVGFEKFRRADGRTYMSGDNLWEKNLYRHEKRQGVQPEDMYKMQHDIYSLGVCLLEIGLGSSFVSFETKDASEQNATGATPNPILEIAEYLNNKDVRARARRIKLRLVELADDRLPGAMGKVYTNVVVSCLTCLDPGNKGFGDESDSTDEDGVLVGIRYIEKILYSLEDIQF